MAIDLGGIWAPIATPLRASGGIDGRALHEHARGVIAEGCQGVLLFGTTGEAPSFSVLERRRALEDVLEAGLPPGRLMVGTVLGSDPC